MKFLENWSIRTKVAVAFGFVLAVTVSLGLVSLQRMSAVNDAAADIRDNWLLGTRLLGDYAFNAMRYRQIEDAAGLA